MPPEQKAAYDLARRLADPEKKRAAGRAYYLKNRERVNAKSRQWALDHADEVVASRKSNPEAWARYRKTWAAANPEATRLRSARYKSRKSGVVSVEEWQAVLTEFDHRCAYCNTGAARLEIEHMKPLSRGGMHVKENVVPACPRCNKRKGGMTAFEFLARPLSPY